MAVYTYMLAKYFDIRRRRCLFYIQEIYLSSCVHLQVERLELVEIPLQMSVVGCPLLFQMCAANPDSQPVLRYTHAST